ncbi:MAG: hypothetical protein GY739_16580 [Mesoflavibacter sp.]|jgi:hypothetical protein|nr:hypothetical protein [Mesoflavibacter sp.]
MNNVSDCNKFDFSAFVSTFGNDHKGAGAIANYAKFVGMDRSTIYRYINSDEKAPAIHETIARLVNDREQAKQELRKLKRQLK